MVTSHSRPLRESGVQLRISPATRDALNRLRAERAARLGRSVQLVTHDDVIRDLLAKAGA